MADPAIEAFVRRQHPLTRKLEALIEDPGAAQGERDNAYRLLEKKDLLPRSDKRLGFLRSQTTLATVAAAAA
jgi:hypothetical protein